MLYLVHFLSSFLEIIELTKFLFSSLISSSHITVASLKISFLCSFCSLVVRWRKCCGAHLRLCVDYSDVCVSQNSMDPVDLHKRLRSSFMIRLTQQAQLAVPLGNSGKHDGAPASGYTKSGARFFLQIFSTSVFLCLETGYLHSVWGTPFAEIGPAVSTQSTVAQTNSASQFSSCVINLAMVLEH